MLIQKYTKVVLHKIKISAYPVINERKKGVFIMNKYLFYNPVPYEHHHPHTYHLDSQTGIHSTQYDRRLGQFHTPFEQYAKPAQPGNWHESLSYMGTNNSSTQSNQNFANTYNGYKQSGYSYLFPDANDSLANQNIYSIQHPNPNPGNFTSNYQSQVNPIQEGPPANQLNTLLTQFQNSEGQLDVDKMINTVGQIANTYHQVAPIVKQFSSFIKTFRN